MKSRRLGGFALPTVLIASMVMLIVLLAAVQSTASIRTSLTSQYYNQLSQTAGEAGVAYAKACLDSNNDVPQWTDANPLMPNTDCTGTQLAGFTCTAASTDARCFVMINGNTVSTFRVGLPQLDGDGKAISIAVSGTTNLLKTSDRTVWRKYEKTFYPAISTPSSPSSLTATGAVNKVVLSWSAPSDNGGLAIKGYKVYRDTTPSPTTLIQTLDNVTTYTDTGLTAGTVYYYRVKAINAIGDGNYSNEANAVTLSIVGGTTADVNGYRIHTFTANGTLTVSGNTSVEVLVVAGGGSGGNSTTTNANGGGGGGGVIYNASFALTAQTYSVTVGSGGIAIANATCGVGNNGGDSIFSTLTAVGGGGGGSTCGYAGKSGGSGGGAAYSSYAAGASTQVGGFGFAGGATTVGYTGAGGGGAGSAGISGSASSPGGNGGSGYSSSISGSLKYYAGGGGGGANSSERAGDGYDGGGRGEGTTSFYNYNVYTVEVNATTRGSGTPNAIANTGGGGGAGSYWAANGGWSTGSGAGGSGIVIIRYQL